MKSTGTPASAKARARPSRPACSTLLNNTRLRPEGAAPSSPRTARWLASVAPLVKMSSPGLQAKTRATVARAALKARFASWPGACCEDAFAQQFDITASMAAMTAGVGGVVALWSR